MAISSPFRLVRLVFGVVIVVVFWTLWRQADLAVLDYIPASSDVESKSFPPPQPDTSNELSTPISAETPKQQQRIFTSKYRIGKLTASFGEPDPSYEDAIESHQLHNELHGYPHFILRQQILSGLWSKHAWIMTIIGQELAKPEDERLHWIFWHDRDTVIMNPQIPLDIFVPPEDRFPNVHLLCTDDRHGLNNGVFMLRVSDWSFKMFSAALAFHEFMPSVELKYTEQSAMEEVIKVAWREKSVAFVPQRWFNGFPPPGTADDQKTPRYARPGSVLIHFASNRDGKRPERMARWHEIANNRTPEWYRPVNTTMYPEEIAEYWDRLERGEDEKVIAKDIGRRSWAGKKQIPKERAHEA